jgi:predicted DNA repair protein MutK
MGLAMTTVHIAPLDDAAKQALIKAVSQQGYANGLKAASILLDKMAAQHMRVVGTNAVRELAAALRGKAVELRREAVAQIATLEASSK